MIRFFSQVAMKMGMSGRATDWDAQQVANLLIDAVDGKWPPLQTPTPPANQALYLPLDLSELTDTEIIHEALKRGFAVMQLAKEKLDDPD